MPGMTDVIRSSCAPPRLEGAGLLCYVMLILVPARPPAALAAALLLLPPPL